MYTVLISHSLTSPTHLGKNNKGLTDYNKTKAGKKNIAHTSEFAEIPCLSMNSRRYPCLNCIPGVWNHNIVTVTVLLTVKPRKP